MKTAATSLLLLLSFCLAQAVAAGNAAEPDGMMPLVFYDYGNVSMTQEPPVRLPAVTVGRLSPMPADLPRLAFPALSSQMSEFPGSLPPGGSRKLVRGIAAGNIRILPPQPGTETLLVLAGPVLNTGELWQPSALERKGNTFTLSVDAWTDNGPRRKNAPGRNAFVLSLGQLPVGEYSLVVHARALLWDFGLNREVYSVTWAGVMGDIRFSVAEGAGNGLAATLEWDGSKLKQPEQLRQLLYQRPRCLTTQGRLGESNGVPKLPYVQVGTFDFAKWLKAQNGAAVLPQVEPPSLTGPIYVVIFAEEMNSYEWLSLGEVAWQGNEVTIRVDAWRDSGQRDKNVPFHPLLVVPLNMPVLLQDGKPLRVPGNYTVTLERRLLLAEQPGSFYVEQADKTDRQTVQFTLK